MTGKKTMKCRSAVLDSHFLSLPPQGGKSQSPKAGQALRVSFERKVAIKEGLQSVYTFLSKL